MPPPKSAGWLGPCTLAAVGCWIHALRARNPALLSGLIGASGFPLLHIAGFCSPNAPFSACNSHFCSFQPISALPSLIPPGPLCNTLLHQSNHSLFLVCTAGGHILPMVVEHGPPQWQSCTCPQHIPPWLAALSHFLSVHFPRARLAP